MAMAERPGGNDPFQDFRNGLEEDNDAERGRRVVTGLAPTPRQLSFSFLFFFFFFFSF